MAGSLVGELFVLLFSLRNVSVNMTLDQIPLKHLLCNLYAISSGDQGKNKIIHFVLTVGPSSITGLDWWTGKVIFAHPLEPLCHHQRTSLGGYLYHGNLEIKVTACRVFPHTLCFLSLPHLVDYLQCMRFCHLVYD